MTCSDWIEAAKAVSPIIAALIVAIGGVIAYVYQRSIDRQDKLREKKQTAYEKYLHGLWDAAAEVNSRRGTSDAHNVFQKEKLSIFLVAPDEVAVAVSRHQRLVQQQGASPAERREAFAEMIKAMRADSFDGSNLTTQQIIDISPINHPDGPPSAPPT